MKRRTSKVLLSLSAVFILWGCDSNSATTLPDADFFIGPGAPFLLRLGDTAGVQTTSSIVLVRFGDLLNDSRCPADVECVDAGFATVRLAVQSALANNEVDIQVPPDGEVEIVVEEITLTVLGLNPEARDGATIDLFDYQVVLRVVQTGDLGAPTS